MKKIVTSVFLLCCCSWLNQLNAQPCTTYKGVEAIVLRYGINSFGQQATQEPFLSSDNTFYLTNHYTTWNEATGAFSTSCSHGFDALVPPVLGHETWNYVCACIEKGPVFWSVNYSCDDDNNNCGISYDFMPVTDPNSSSTNWSSPTTWKNDSYNNLTTALGRFISKPISIDVNVSNSSAQWLVIGNTGTTSIVSGTTFTNDGTIQVRTGSVLQNDGTLTGTGVVQGSLINNGTLAPGSPTGTFSVLNDYTATTAAVHQIDIAGLSSYDYIKVGGDPYLSAGGVASLNGTLNVSLLNGFIPSLGDTYKIFTFASSTGVFATTNLPTLPGGLCWSIHYNPTDVTLEVVNTCLPLISIADKSLTEGNTGTKPAKLKVTLSSASTSTVTVNYTTVDSIATAGTDYVAKTGKLKFNPGQTSKTISILINGDTQVEPTEKIKVLLSVPVNANIADNLGIVTIRNDDAGAIAANNNTGDAAIKATIALKISPNPGKDQITVSGLSAGAANYIELTDLNGRILLKEKVTGSTTTISIAKYASGIYLLRYFDGSKVQQVKLVKE